MRIGAAAVCLCIALGAQAQQPRVVDSDGDPCEAFAYHGYNGIEREVVGRITAWITGERS
jgi:hypothetical protein